MKKNLQRLVLLAFLAAGTAASAQYNRAGGVDRSLTGQYSNNKKKKEKKSDDQYLEESVQKLSDQLNLDSFQQAVVKQLLLDEEENVKRIIAEDIPNKSKGEKVGESHEKLNEKIKAVLNPEQLAKFEALAKKKTK